MDQENIALGVRMTEMLSKRGITHIFGIPGVHNQELYRGMPDSGITHILARHEQGAGFMADGYARATGKPGIAYVITGPGLLNILTPLGQAYSDSVSVLAISSCLDDHVGVRGQLHQMLDQRAAGATVTAASDEALSARAAYKLIDRAFSAFETDRNRPRHIQVPIKVLEAAADPAPHPKKPSVARATGHSFAAHIDLIASAKRPLFVLGVGCWFDGCHEAIAMMLAKTGAGVFTSYAGRGLIDPNHPALFGSTLAQTGAIAILEDADLIVTLGCELSENDMWRDDLGHSAPMIRVDIDVEVLADRHGAEYPVQAKTQDFIAALINGLPEEASPPAYSAAEVTTARAKLQASASAIYPGVQPVADALAQVLPTDVTIFSDMTQFAYASKEIWDLPIGSRWHHPTGFGTLGYALPAAIGGKVGLGDAPVIAIAGDYGFQYTVNELATAVELRQSLPILLWDNGKLGAIEDSMVGAQIGPNAVIAENPDFLALARAYGAYAIQPATLKDLCADVLNALKADRPTVIRMTPDLATT